MFQVIAGNVATGAATKEALIEAGVDAVKVIIGPWFHLAAYPWLPVSGVPESTA